MAQEERVKNQPTHARGRAMAGEKAKNFRGTITRLLKGLVDSSVNRLRCLVVLLLLIISAACSAYAPKALGNGTNILFDGLISNKITDQIHQSIEKSIEENPQTKDLPKKQQEDAANQQYEEVKKSVDNPDGTLNVDKVLDQMEKVSGDDASKIDSIKQMAASMTIKLGEGVDFVKFAWMLGFVILIYFGMLFTRMIAGWISVRLITELSMKLRQQIEEKIWHLPLSYFDKTSRGEVMSRTTNDLDNVTQTLKQTGGDLIFMVLMVISVIGMMFSVDWLLALIALITIPVSFGIIGIIMKHSQPRFRGQWKQTGILNGHIEESFTGHTLIKSYGQAQDFEAKFKVNNDQLFESSFKAQFISGVIMPVMTFMTNLNYVIVALVGAYFVTQGRMSLGDVQAFIQYSRQYSQPLGQISQSINLLQSGAASAERIFELLDAEEESNEESLPQKLDSVQGKVEFKHVEFSYDPDVKLIEDMNLVAEPGKTVAIVGPTGAGKTTLVNLIMRFYEVNSGNIELDGIDTKSISRGALRSNVGMVLQDTWLFKGTIEENLKYGVPEGKTVTDEEFLAATKATYVDHFVNSLSDGYQTVLDDDAQISVGEKQLLTIARAFLANPDILILDEATSSVDTRTEVLVQKAMNRLRENRTSFVIAQRLSTIRDADVIIVMEHGHIVEQGNHETLMAKQGEYYRLYDSQFDPEEL
ncbi:MAG: ABC transporter ATP-binding protein/permease [Candidatus Ancillula sp.]|jgi:ATP-binding cassette subfamily B protein|nr:ABC transporter ATP-binding protein/permease [Candidatus Ancillula sp.]